MRKKNPRYKHYSPHLNSDVYFDYLKSLTDAEKKKKFLYVSEDECETYTYKIRQKTMTEILKKFNEILMREVILRGRKLRLPAGMGSICVSKYKRRIVNRDGTIKEQKKKDVDWESTRELWKRDPIAKKEKVFLWFVNDHSDGYTYRFHWDNTYCTAKNKKAYNLQPARINSRWLAKVLKAGDLNIDYYDSN